MARRRSIRPGRPTTSRPRQPSKKIPYLNDLQIPFRAPFGTYDPGLDAAERATNRGLADLTDDIGRADDRGYTDYNLSKADVTRGRDESLADMLASKQRFDRDLGTNRTRTTEDYTRSIEGLDRNYSRLANRQAQSARQSGNVQGGALAQALAKRTANKAIDKAPIDTGFQRANQDFQTREADFNANYSTQTGRIAANAERQVGRLGLGVRRDLEDRHLVQLPRAQREAREFGLDTQESRIAQVKQTAPDFFADWMRRRKKAGLSTRLGRR